jgi:hypothetical protein
VPEQVAAPPPRFPPGHRVRGQYTKWGGKRHHGADLVYLGADEHGDWLGDWVGNPWSGGPKSFVSVTDNVLFVPRGRGMTAMFYSAHPEQAFELYVDITSVPQWQEDLVTAVDLDLDVIRRFDGTWFVDDEDEFAEHQVSYAYPLPLVAAAEAECARVVEEIRSGAAVFDNATAARWHAVLGRVLGR